MKNRRSTGYNIGLSIWRLTCIYETATDGDKIINGDTAHNSYWGIMDLYESGADFHTIDKEFPLVQVDNFDDFDNEIYGTSCALALWEIGQMTGDKLTYVKSIIDKEACIKVWTEEYDPKAGKARQKEPGRFWEKISQPKAVIHKLTASFCPAGWVASASRN